MDAASRRNAEILVSPREVDVSIDLDTAGYCEPVVILTLHARASGLARSILSVSSVDTRYAAI